MADARVAFPVVVEAQAVSPLKLAAGSDAGAVVVETQTPCESKPTATASTVATLAVDETQASVPVVVETQKVFLSEPAAGPNAAAAVVVETQRPCESKPEASASTVTTAVVVEILLTLAQLQQ